MESDSNRPLTLSAEVALPAQARLGEGPLWERDEATLWWVDILAARVHRFSPRSGTDDSFETGSPVGAVGLRADGGLVLALEGNFATADRDGRRLEAVTGFTVDTVAVRFNDGKVDPWGGFCAGTMDRSDERSRGALYRLGPDLAVTVLRTEVACSNGLDWTDDGRYLYYIDTPTRSVDRFAIDPETGGLRRRQRVVRLDGPGMPDGMALDGEGCVWVALWGGGQVRRYTPGGRLDRVITLPVSLVTSVAFGGDHLDELYITTASDELSAQARRDEPHAGDLFWCAAGVRGRPSHRFGGGGAL